MLCYRDEKASAGRQRAISPLFAVPGESTRIERVQTRVLGGRTHVQRLARTDFALRRALPALRAALQRPLEAQVRSPRPSANTRGRAGIPRGLLKIAGLQSRSGHGRVSSSLG